MDFLLYAELGFVYCMAILAGALIFQLTIYQVFGYSVYNNIVKVLNKLDKKISKIF